MEASWTLGNLHPQCPSPISFGHTELSAFDPPKADSGQASPTIEGGGRKERLGEHLPSEGVAPLNTPENEF
jgi:hypothetical protein